MPELLNTYPLFYLLWQAVLLVVLLDMTNRRRSPSSMIAWFLVIFTVPYLGVFLYLFIGRRKLADTPFKADFSHTRHDAPGSLSPIESVLHRHGIPPATEGNAFELISDGKAAFHALESAIENARHSICLATYIFGDDDVTRRLTEKLIERARRGVQVRLLIDAVGSLDLYLRPAPLKPMETAGIKIEFFMPLRPFLRNTHFNLRLHRKIYLFDGRTVFSGGMNLSRDYFGPDDDPVRWNDLLFRIEGPAVGYYRQVFASDWAFSSPTALPEPGMPPAAAGGERLQVVPSGPDIASDALYDALLNAIFNARERIWIVTPYFIPDEATMHALRIAHIKGVDVRLITPKTPDHAIFEIARSSYMREIEEWGGRVAVYTETMLHAKAILIDDDHVVVGTLNFDQRSLFLNYEVVCLGHGGGILRDVDRWMRRLLEHCEHGLPAATRTRKILENLGRIVAPQL